MSSISGLVNKRGNKKSKITKLETKINTVAATDAGIKPEDAKRWLNQLDEVRKEFEVVCDAICDNCPTEDYQVHADEYSAVCERLLVLEELVQQAIPVPQEPPQQDQQQTPVIIQSNPNPKGNFKLLTLELPTFDGNVLDWMSFQNSFTSAVHNNPNLTNSVRLQYLKVSCKGQAAARIESLQISDNNYQIAWDILVKRYEDKKTIINAILGRLLHQQQIQSESAQSLRKFVDVISECVRSLKVLEIPVEKWDAILLFLLVEKLDRDTRKQWELSAKAGELPTLDEFTEFIEARAKSFSSLPAIKTKPPVNNHQQHGNGRQQDRRVHLQTGDQSKCPLCPDRSHPFYACPNFRKATVQERWEHVRKARVCFNCLSKGHSVQECKLGSCKSCKKSHNSLLHQDQPAAAVPTQTVFHSANTNEKVLLATALVKIPDSHGNHQIFRALIDPGAQVSIITEYCKQKTGLKSTRVNFPLAGLGAVGLGVASKLGTVSLNSCTDYKFSLTFNALVLPRVTGTLPNSAIQSTWKHLSDLSLADPGFHTPGQVDILLGADVCASIMQNGVRRGPQGTPTAWRSSLGWLVIGTVRQQIVQPPRVFITEVDMKTALEKFWEQEEVSKAPSRTSEEIACEEHFDATHKKVNNRYMVELPFKEDPTSLGTSRHSAVRRLLQQEKQQAKDPFRQKEYSKFMQEYITLDHMELIPKNELNAVPHYYFPHHAVLKESSTTTKLRVVFSGKEPTSTGKSLNDLLMVGPKLQPDLIAIMIRFRTHLIAFTADIAKMYRQVLVAPQHRTFQRIVWRDSPSDPIQDYCLKTVTYGTASAPHHAIKALQQLALDNIQQFPTASKVVLNDFYVDDLLSGCSTPQEAIKLFSELTLLMDKGSFQLRKWTSNSAQFLDSVPSSFKETPPSTSTSTFEEKDVSIKTLGIRWHPINDWFTFDITTPPIRASITKRQILSDTLKTFDPWGSLAPTTVQMKLFLQKLWKDAKGWDDALPSETQESWNDYQRQLVQLAEIKIPRCLVPQFTTIVQLHGFCDASEKAFAAAVYIRCINLDGSVHVQLIASKTRVAPLKKISLPRLELCSADLVADLVAIFKPALNLPITETIGWNDSKIALYWIAAHPSRWKTYVANRVTSIQASPIQRWCHVRSEDNPADCASRGIDASELVDHPLWWSGPPWLQDSRFVLPVSQADHLPNEALSEERQQPKLVVHLVPDLAIMNRFSSLIRLKRVTAYIFRFISAMMKKASCQSGPLTVEELNKAFVFWVKQVQATHFHPELLSLKSNKPIPHTSKLITLNPFIDYVGILRVGGRLQHAQIPYNQKFPILLPQTNHLTSLILQHEHLASFHAGAQLMWANLSTKYWILNSRDVICRSIRKCVVCCRHRKEVAQQMMGDLPPSRVTPTRAFLNTGVDYAGPFYLRNSKGRVKSTYKSWIALFVCFSTRAIHLELVSDLSTDAFLAALRRFIARRGKCQSLSSDCGTNFVGANNELKDLLQLFRSVQHNNRVTEFLSNDEISWNFNPPAAPHMGGLWEAGVKSVKFHLRRIVGNTTLTFEEFYTLLTQVEACLNSRPLCPISSDPTDLSVLTPGHFLIGDALTAIPEPSLIDIKENRLSRWQHVQQLHQHFCKRYKAEYLTRLNQRPKWHSQQPNITSGALVLIKDDNLPPMKWKLGRITKVHHGLDGLVRVVTIKTAAGELKRPIAKVSLLPFDSS